jgi:hypothetical protein
MFLPSWSKCGTGMNRLPFVSIVVNGVCVLAFGFNPIAFFLGHGFGLVFVLFVVVCFAVFEVLFLFQTAS